MKKRLTKMAVFSVLLLIFANSVSYSQTYASILKRLDAIEQRIDDLNSSQSSQIKKLQTQISSIEPSGDYTEVQSSITFIDEQIQKLSAEIEQIKAGFDEGSAALSAERANIEGLAGELRSLVTELRGVIESPSVPEAPVKAGKAGEAIEFEAVYTGELNSNTSGGIRAASTYLDNLDLAFTFDTEKLLGWDNTTFFIYILGNSGGDPTGENIGDIQTASNIETDETWKFYEVWLEKLYAGDRYSLKAGLYDLNSEIDAIEAAGLFTNSSHGIGPDFSQSGEMGPSIFSTTSLGIRLRANINDNLILQTAVLDGVSGNPENPVGTQIKFGKDDGVLLASELNYFTNLFHDTQAFTGKFALGGWFYNSEFEDIRDVDESGDPVMRNGNYGIYASLEQPLIVESSQDGQGMAAFVRTGFANQDVNQLGFYLGFGFSYTGLFPNRDEDMFGIAFANAFNGGKFKDAMSDAGMEVDNAETDIEIIYRAQINDWLAFQPDFQYIINPGTDPNADNAVVVSARLEITF